MKKINESFICLECWKNIPEAKKTCRNHCPFCFSSQHVDWKIPGDRVALEICGWVMYPFEYEIRNWTTKIHFRCVKCNKLHWNKASIDDDLSVLDEKIVLYKEKFLQNQ